MFSSSNLILLRVHFSLFLLPVFLFAVSQAEDLNVKHTWIMFFVLHLLVYPASNGYNSYMDRDESPIGGLKNPPKADRGLFYLTLLLDLAACLTSFYVSWMAMGMVLVYILASRAYSYRGIRIKKYAVAGFLTVAFFQGCFTYLLTYVSCSNNSCSYPEPSNHTWAMAASTFLIAGIYPMTQIYQHEADMKDGVITLSYKLGHIGTFVLCALCFALAMGCMFMHFKIKNSLNNFMAMQVFLLPVIGFSLFWFYRVWNDRAQASFENTMKMNLISSLCLNLCFLYFILLR